MSTRNLSIVGLLAAVALFFAVNILGTAVLRSARLDLTENRLFTLTKGSRNIAKAVEEPIHLRLYFSKQAANALPGVKAYATRVRETLDEYSRLSGGTIEVSVIDPVPFSEEEDEAVAAGLVAVPTGSGTSLFFGLVGTNSTDDQKIIPFFDGNKEQFLEYDLTKLIYTLMNPRKPTVGLLSSLPIEGTEFDPRNPQNRQPPWQIVVQMKEVFEVKTVKPDDLTLPEGLDVLMVVHPKGLSDDLLYAIDQYVLKGGKLLAFVDPNCEIESINPNMNLQASISQDKSSNLTRLFDAWGVSMARDKVVADKTGAVIVNASGNPNRPETAPYIAWLKCTPDLGMLNKDDAVAGQFREMILATAGILDKKAGDGANSDLVFTPILTSTEDSMRMDQSRVQFMPQPKELLADFSPGGEKLTLGARISGRLASAFPDKAAPPPPEGAAPQPSTHVAKAADPVTAFVCSDVDMIADRFWITEDRIPGLQILLGYRKVSDNGDFVLSLIDQLTGSQDLISVRARGQYARPFTRVQAIQKEAERKHLATQQALDTEIREAEKRIAEIQRQRPDQATTQDGRIILTAEQQQEIQKLQEKLLATRKEKRQVELQMRKDIERLQFTLNVVNTATIPLVVCVVALGLAGFRASRRRADRARASRSPS